MQYHQRSTTLHKWQSKANKCKTFGSYTVCLETWRRWEVKLDVLILMWKYFESLHIYILCRLGNILVMRAVRPESHGILRHNIPGNWLMFQWHNIHMKRVPAFEGLFKSVTVIFIMTVILLGESVPCDHMFSPLIGERPVTSKRVYYIVKKPPWIWYFSRDWKWWHVTKMKALQRDACTKHDLPEHESRVTDEHHVAWDIIISIF